MKTLLSSPKPQSWSHALQSQLVPGRAYRRAELVEKSNAVDRHLSELVANGNIKKLAQGLYYKPKQSRFGPLPPNERQLIEAFLGDKVFLNFSPSVYNTVGLGTTQLYNTTVVYNHKRHGVFKLGNRQFSFRVKPRFPKTLSAEFLFVDLLNNLSELAEDQDEVLQKAKIKVISFDQTRLRKTADSYGSAATRKLLRVWLHG